MKANVVTLGGVNMSGNQEFPGAGIALGARARSLTQAEVEHTEVLLSLFEKHLRGTRANGKKTIQLALGALRVFQRYVGLPPWEWQESDVSDFLSYKVQEDGIGLGRQATYLTYLRSFQNYIIESRGLTNEIHRKFGIQPQRFVTNENAIPIKRKRHSRKKIIKPLSALQCQLLIEQFDAEIRQANLAGSKSYNTLRRDKAMTMVCLLSGVRVDELVNLKLNSFMPDLKYPNFGEFALLTVVGKGRKTRVVRFYNPIIKELMDWYLDEVRPCFLGKETTDPNRLFLSERGGDICTEQVRRTLLDIGSNSGIPIRVTPHLLRHTYATQMANVIGPEALQQQIGHEHLSTTLGTYYHQDPEQVGNQVQQGIENFTQAIDAMTKGLFDEDHD
jgi:site-specific recombinase XerD